MQVKVRANTDETYGDFGQVVGGAFLGARNSKNRAGKNITVALQQVNANHSEKIDNYYETPGATVLQEVTEAYAGAKLVQKRGTDSGSSGDARGVYEDAHKMATEPPPLEVTAHDEKVLWCLPIAHINIKSDFPCRLPGNQE